MIRVFISLSLCMLLCSCLDKIDLGFPKGLEKALVIDARLLINEGVPSVTVAIERLFNFTGESREFVSIESVKLIDENLNETEIPVAFLRTFSAILDSTLVSTGNNYKVWVKIADGRTYESNFETINQVPKIEATFIDTIQKEIPDLIGGFQVADFLRFSVKTCPTLKGKGEKVFLYWESIRDVNFLDFLAPNKTCTNSNSIIFNDVKILDGNELESDCLESFSIYERKIDSAIQEGYCFSIVQLALDRNGYNYWKWADQNMKRDGSTFEPPPGALPSNFKNVNQPDENVYGYFYASEVETYTF